MTDDRSLEIDRFIEARNAFFQAVQNGYCYTSFISTDLTSADERDFLQAIRVCKLPAKTIVETLADDASNEDCWKLTTFGIRRAITAVRTADEELFRIGLLTLLAGLPSSDWRDALGELAIVEDCGNRLGLGLQGELEQILSQLSDARVKKICGGYFSRDPTMRDVRVMGRHSFGTNEELWYQ